MSRRALSDAKRRLLDRLKRTGESPVAELAGALGLTTVAVRQHLLALEQNGLVRQRTQPPCGRGRPCVRWSLTDLAAELFPDRHAELTVGLIDAMRRAVGEDGLQRVIETRTNEQIAAYRRSLPGGRAPLKRRVEALARQRSLEGYMAEVTPHGRGAYLLIENHCPICSAAKSCTGLCAAELRAFQEALGDDVTVERAEHIVAGDRRCTYVISRKRSN